MSVTQTTAPTADTKTAAPDPQVVAPGDADRMIALVGNDPNAAAELIRKNPSQRDPLLAAMHSRMGNGYVQQVMHALGTTKDGTSDTATELTVINADCVNENGQLSSTAGPAIGAITAAIKVGDSAALKTGSETAANAFARADATASAARTELDATSDDNKKKPEFKAAEASLAALNNTINQQATSVLRSLAIPGVIAAQAKVAGGESYEADIRAHTTPLVTKLDTVARLVEQSTAASQHQGAERKAGADQVRSALLSASAADRAYAISVMQAKGVAPDILDYYRGKSQALRTAAGPASELGVVDNASADANAQGGFTHSTALPNLKPTDGPKADQKSNLKTAKADATTGEVGAGIGTKDGSVSAGGSADLRGDDGSLRFEGLKGEFGLAQKGKQNAKVSGGYTQITSPPTFDGVRWSVAWSITVSGGISRNTTKTEDAPVVGTVGLDAKASGSIVKSGVKAYDDQASAQKAYDDSGFELALVDPASMVKPPDAAAATALKEGESVTIGHSGDVGGGVSGGQAGVAVGLGGTVGGGNSSQVTKTAGGKVVVTIRDVSQASVSGSVATTGLSEGIGAGNANVTSTVVEIDLNTDAGKAAYAEWLKTPEVAPKKGDGVKLVSTGTGDFTSKNIGIGVGLGPVSGTGTNTSTTGEFTEKSADGKHEQSTIVGTQTDATKGFNPLNADKNTRTDSLEIKTNDGKTDQSSYTTKTSIAATQDQQFQGDQLRKTLGETDKIGKLEGKAAGAYSIEGTYTPEQMKKFETEVANGRYISGKAGEAGGPAEALKKVLGDPKSTEHDKQTALASWYATRGADANDDLRSVIGPPEMSVTLANDKYLTGNTGKAAFEGKRQELEDRFLNPDLKEDPLKQLLRDVQLFYTELMEKRDHIANPANYPELPVQLRHTLVQQVEAQYAAVALLRARVAARCKEQNVGDDQLASKMGLDKKMAAVKKARLDAAQMRSTAVDVRAKHNGALSAGHGDTPREQLEPTLGTNAAKKAYDSSDIDWSNGILHMTHAEEAEREMFKEDALSGASVSTAMDAADKSTGEYRTAIESFMHVKAKLESIIKNSGKVVNWDGANKENYGTLD